MLESLLCYKLKRKSIFCLENIPIPIPSSYFLYTHTAHVPHNLLSRYVLKNRDIALKKYLIWWLSWHVPACDSSKNGLILICLLESGLDSWISLQTSSYRYVKLTQISTTFHLSQSDIGRLIVFINRRKFDFFINYNDFCIFVYGHRTLHCLLSSAPSSAHWYIEYFP